MLNAAYHLTRPKTRTTSVVFASPHSGRDYPPAFLRQVVLDDQEIRSSEDAFVDLLFDKVPDHGAPLLTATAPRAYLDLNRGPDELDAALVEGVRRSAHNPRIASGLGVIPRVVANGRQIYRGKMTLQEAHQRIARYWRPYHDQLQTLLDESKQYLEEAILIDVIQCPTKRLKMWARPVRRDPTLCWGTGSARRLRHRWSNRSKLHLPVPVSGWPAYAICRRLHHATLRQARPPSARDPS